MFVVSLGYLSSLQIQALQPGGAINAHVHIRSSTLIYSTSRG